MYFWTQGYVKCISRIKYSLNNYEGINLHLGEATFTVYTGKTIQ